MSLDPVEAKKGKFPVCSRAYHPELHYPLIIVAEMSLEKGYSPLNWLPQESPVTSMYLINAAQRHLDKVKLGIDLNQEETKMDGTKIEGEIYHAAQAAYNLLMLCMKHKKNTLIDDRMFKDGEIA